MKEAKVKEIGKELMCSCVTLGKTFWLVIKEIGLFLNECYTWIANVRCKAPRTSLTIEIILFSIISFMFMMSCYIDKTKTKDRTSKKLYDMEVSYNQKVIKAEIDGYNRGLEENKSNRICYEKEQTDEE